MRGGEALISLALRMDIVYNLESLLLFTTGNDLAKTEV